ncbi:hypothetical protein ACFE04_006172 [Oxalis oulophora]
MLVALANSGIQVIISIPNEQLLGIGQSNSTAANWVSKNVVAHYPATNIVAICVGSEVLTTLPNAASILVNAMRFIHSALVASNLDRQIKVSTPLPSTMILDSFPPSQAFFNRSLNSVMVPMLNFLQSTEAVDANTLVHYSNVFDATVDAAYFAMAFLNFTDIPVVHVLSKTGTPKSPGIALSTYIYELYNEDLKPGPVSEKNWGLFDANGKPVYILHLIGSGSAALDWACGAGKVNCSILLQGEPYYEPDNVNAHATYAFDAYYQKMGRNPEACDFNDVAAITTTNPSHGSCVFSGSLGKNGSFRNITAPSLNSTIANSSGHCFGSVTFAASFMVLVQLVLWSLILL